MKKISFNKKIILEYFYFIFIINLNTNINLVFSLLTEKKIRGFLNVIAICEGTKKINRLHPILNFYPSLQEYQVPLFNKEKITNLKEYPNKLFSSYVRQKKISGSASGRYQFIKKTWLYLNKKYNMQKIYNNFYNNINEYFLDMPDIYQKDIINLYKDTKDILKYKFGPFWQDFYAIILLIENNAINDILNNQYGDAITKASKIWASFPKNENGLSFYSHDHVNKAKKFNYIIELCKKYIINN